jgi:alpha-tubulin suppressor-like RCC1 family protein
MTTNFQINGIDTDDLLVRKDYFTEGGLWLWGSDTYGEIGNNTSGNYYSSPVQTIAGGTNWKQVSCSNMTIAAIKSDGTLWTWGRGDNGQLGDNTAVSKSSPVQTIAAGTNWKQVSVGRYNCGAIKSDGTLWIWGNNDFGQLGDNTITVRSSPVQTIAAGSIWKQIASSTVASHTAAIKTDGTLWLWGFNAYGQLGTNDRTSRSSPVQTVASGTNWKQVSCGLSCTGAIKTDGTLWMWGDQLSFPGQLGTNNRTSYSSPVQTVAGGTNWKYVDVSKENYTGTSCGIKTDGTLWLWGTGSFGQLGNNNSSISTVSSPIQTIAGGTNWKQVCIAGPFVSSIRADYW